MASKYLSAGTASWTAATKTIAGATMSAVFELGDATYRRQVIFRIGTNIYYGRVTSFVSGTSIILQDSGSLPSSDGTIAELFLLDLGEEHSYQHFVEKIKTMIKDNAGVLTQDDIDAMISQAVHEYSNDKPFFVKKKIAGNGTTDYVLSTIFGSLWVEGFSYVKNVEFPFGETSPRLLGTDDWAIYDDGTMQDGSNRILRFLIGAPTLSEYFVVEFLTAMNLPIAGAKNFPDTEEHFTNITLLAAEHCCLLLAAHFAQSSDSTLSADIVNYNDKSGRYTRLASLYKKRYNVNVFGQEESDSSAAMVSITPSSDGRFVFHR